jgi:OOP family OmpA-OmpF porin
MKSISVMLSTAAFALASLAAYFAAGMAVAWIENSSAKAVEQRLAMEDYPWASVQTDGLQIILEGEVPSEAARFKALAAAGIVVEAARVIDNFTIQDRRPPIPPKFSVEILRNDTSISLIGLVPTSADNTNFRSRIARIAGDLPVADFLETADYPEPDSWSSAVSYALLALSRLEHSKISIRENQVNIEAIGETAEQKAKFLEELTRRTPTDIKSKIFISAPRPVITPFTLRFRISDDGALFDACSADTPQAAARILSAAKAAGVQNGATCRQGLGVPSPRWGEAAALSIAALAKLGGGSVTLSDADVTLTSAEGTDPTLFDNITSKLDRDLPEIFALERKLLVNATELEGQENPPELIATLSPEGQVQIRGPVHDIQAKRTLETFAFAIFGTENVYVSTTIRANLPNFWLIRNLASLAALGKLNSGLVEVTPNSVIISGNTGSTAAKTDISQILLDRIGNTVAFQLDVTYLEKLDPLARMLAGPDCLAEITTLVTDNKITFEPGSTTLDSNSQNTIDAIAEVFNSCLEAPIEIGGHTDSQGREEMNLNLSQSRADAVLNALRAGRVKLKALTSQGYGEAHPIDDNKTEVGREANRRIEFRLVPTEAATSQNAPVTDMPTTAEETSNEQN